MNGYVFREEPGEPRHKLFAGQLADALSDRLSERPATWRVRLVHLRNGVVVSTGPWRTPAIAIDAFATTIAHAELGDVLRIHGRRRRLFAVRVVPASAGDRVMEAAKLEIGTPYVFGAENGPQTPGKDAYDCSGFTAAMWGLEGIVLPHNANDQRVLMLGQHRFFIDEPSAQNGDLVFMWAPNSRGIPPGNASHVGLHAGNGRTGRVLDTRRPRTEPVAFRDAFGVIGYGNPG